MSRWREGIRLLAARKIIEKGFDGFTSFSCIQIKIGKSGICDKIVKRKYLGDCK